jgi:hypothetical protein
VASEVGACAGCLPVFDSRAAPLQIAKAKLSNTQAQRPEHDVAMSNAGPEGCIEGSAEEKELSAIVSAIVAYKQNTLAGWQDGCGKG